MRTRTKRMCQHRNLNNGAKQRKGDRPLDMTRSLGSFDSTFPSLCWPAETMMEIPSVGGCVKYITFANITHLQKGCAYIGFCEPAVHIATNHPSLHTLICYYPILCHREEALEQGFAGDLLVDIGGLCRRQRRLLVSLVERHLALSLLQPLFSDRVQPAGQKHKGNRRREPADPQMAASVRTLTEPLGHCCSESCGLGKLPSHLAEAQDVGW